MIVPIKWENGKIYIIDQRRLPLEVIWHECDSYMEVGDGIKDMCIRGAPAIGIAGAFGILLAAKSYHGKDFAMFLKVVNNAASFLLDTRPTAINLKWAIVRMLNVLKLLPQDVISQGISKCQEILEIEAVKIMMEDQDLCKKIGEAGKDLLINHNHTQILTHCNAGGLATGGWGTALGVIRSAHESGLKLHVYVDETRPALQGSRLTSWELQQDGIPCTLITDSMAGFLMQQGKIHTVIVGADRITANGDFANKIGTYTVAVLAKTHGIPFYVAAPYSSFDFSLASGSQIPIEERNHTEVTSIKNCQIAPEGIPVWNPSFDITPHKYVSAFITDMGVITPPFKDNFYNTFQKLKSITT